VPPSVQPFALARGRLRSWALPLGAGQGQNRPPGRPGAASVERDLIEPSQAPAASIREACREKSDRFQVRKSRSRDGILLKGWLSHALGYNDQRTRTPDPAT
jgi:hypothetical protein